MFMAEFRIYLVNLDLTLKFSVKGVGASFAKPNRVSNFEKKCLDEKNNFLVQKFLKCPLNLGEQKSSIISTRFK